MTPAGPTFQPSEGSQPLPLYQGPLSLASHQLSHVTQAPSSFDLSLVTPIYSSALSSFLTKRNSPLTVPMFLSLFSRHPVSVVTAHPWGRLLSPVPTSQPCHCLPRRSARACSPSWSSM